MPCQQCQHGEHYKCDSKSGLECACDICASIKEDALQDKLQDQEREKEEE